jgi:uncharacterized lipoprotein YddW (UPF0748 family)
VRRFLLALILVLLSGCTREGQSPEAPPPEPTRLGLWVLAEGSHRALEHPDRIEALIGNAEALGVTDLFIQVYRGGRSWFPSTHADDGPYRKIRAAHDLDPLPRVIDAAHAKGMRVHAWFNALSLAGNREAPLLERVGRDAVVVDRKGRSMLDYPGLDVPEPDWGWLRMGTPGVWLDPAVPGVIEYLERTVDDLLAVAPHLDGLHLDYIRHALVLPLGPGSRFDVGLDFGYGEDARRRFEAESKRAFARGDAWDAFRRERVGEVVRRLCARLPEGAQCSAAVLPWATRAYLTAMQDFRRWLEEGWLDFAVAMLYTRDDRLLRYTAASLRGGVAGDAVWVGLGTWLFVGDPGRIRAQITAARDVDPSGIALFSYDALTEAPETLRLLTEIPPLAEGP